MIVPLYMWTLPQIWFFSAIYSPAASKTENVRHAFDVSPEAVTLALTKVPANELSHLTNKKDFYKLTFANKSNRVVTIYDEQFWNNNIISLHDAFGKTPKLARDAGWYLNRFGKGADWHYGFLIFPGETHSFYAQIKLSHIYILQQKIYKLTVKYKQDFGYKMEVDSNELVLDPNEEF